jgi:hypothetical protein
MATTKRKSAESAKAPDAIKLLTEDHRKVQKMFKDFEKLKEKGEDQDKAALIEAACAELTIHAQLEEEIFYPKVREAIDDMDVMDEAEVEHASAKELIAQLKAMQPGDELYEAKFTVLGEYVNHHIQEEEKKMFPQVKKAKLDLRSLAEQIQPRKQELQEEMGLTELEEDEAKEESEEEPREKRAGR